MPPFSTAAIGLTLNTFGAGLEMAMPLAQQFNLRSIVNVVDYGYKFTSNGGDYNAEIHFHSAQMMVDWFPFYGGFHISPGIMAFNNKLAVQVRVPAGQTYDFEDYELTSSQNDPIHGGATATYPRRIAPVLMTGFTDILPRNGSHFTAPFEIGVAYPGTAQITANLQGTTCKADGCSNIADDLDAQRLLRQKQEDLNEEVKKFQIYPIVSMGLAFRF